MAQKVITQLVSDITGKDIADGEGETVTFALDNVSYEIDVTTKEADKLRGLFQDYIAAGRKSGRTSTGRKSSSSSTGGSGRSKSDLASIRDWAKSNGHEVSERGRIKAEVLEAYDAAN